MSIILVPFTVARSTSVITARSKTGTEYVTAALRELQVLDPTATAIGEQLEDGLQAATDLLDTWRTQRLTIGGLTIATYTLVNGQASYTIGEGGNFDQAYPNSLEYWSVIPDSSAADPLELPMGRPLTFSAWQQIRQKSQTAPYPTSLRFDNEYTSGLGHILVHPIPDNSTVQIRLYAVVPTITVLEAGVNYDLRPGFRRALTLNLALELADRYGKGATVTPRLEKRAGDALASLKRSNIKPQESQMRAEFVIGQGSGRRTHNVYTDE